MKVVALIMTMTLLIFTSRAKAADAAAGSKQYSSCLECHGQNAQGVEGKGPRLAGQFDWYIVTALTDYKSGARKHPAMKSLTEQDMQDLAAHISRLK